MGYLCFCLWTLLLTCAFLAVGGENDDDKNISKQDLITRLPGQPNVSFDQYAGYVNVAPSRSLFYYFVEAEENPDSKPLALWLNGGPGCSSVGIGAFIELGPFYPSATAMELLRNSESWNKACNLLFVDSPAGVGWSYSDHLSFYETVDDELTARDMLSFMVIWLNKFPKFQNRKLFLSGESYAGHYIPQLAIKMLEYNANSNYLKFNIVGLMIGNPLLRAETDFALQIDNLWSRGMISDETLRSIKKHCGFDNYSFFHPNDSCIIAIKEARRSVGKYINPYDVFLDACQPSLVEQELRLHKKVSTMNYSVDVCIEKERTVYFNSPHVQKAFHANRINLQNPWVMCSDIINYKETDRFIDMIPILKTIIQNKIRVLVYSGDQDSVIPLTSTRRLISDVALDLQLNVTEPYGAWFSGEQVGGWVIGYENILSFATARGAGHAVPYSQPARAFKLFSTFINGHRLPRKPEA